MRIAFFTFLIAMVLAALVTPVVRKFAVRSGVMDQPDERRVHREPTPRWGGIAIYLAFWMAVVPIAFWWSIWSDALTAILVLGTVIALFGMIDDRVQVAPVWQMVVLLGAGMALTLFGIRIEGVTHPLAPLMPGEYRPEYWLPLGLWSLPVTALWVFVVTKTVDAIDGLDGLAAGVAAISASTLTLMAVSEKQMAIAIPAAALAGACVGFLRHNMNPASIFMGTVGAQFIGFVLATLAIVGTFKVAATISVLVPLLVLGVPFFDAFFVVSRRVLARQPLHKADMRHFHHWLVGRLGHRRAVVVIWCIGLVFSAAAFTLYRMTR
ncbi:MAG: MraY family glycosyltransferase [Armatimonadota bacterium]|nr:undecaprenyl/decaprenyl-phosphate alpha-N-acetylglucosaminyl 1-phosphate transferase [bacterium]MDW8320091.1 MraY family glycosyltransferase [Armatimonadota bacterium]